jgi:hypothetical protein
MPDATYDQVEVRCPVAGYQLNFGHCRVYQGGLPCGKILECYQGRVPASEVLRKSLGNTTYQRLFMREGQRRSKEALEAAERLKRRRAS